MPSYSLLWTEVALSHQSWAAFLLRTLFLFLARIHLQDFSICQRLESTGISNLFHLHTWRDLPHFTFYRIFQSTKYIDIHTTFSNLPNTSIYHIFDKLTTSCLLNLPSFIHLMDFVPYFRISFFRCAEHNMYHVMQHVYMTWWIMKIYIVYRLVWP